MLKILLSLSLVLMVGCTSSILPLEISGSNLQVRPIARVSAAGPMAISADGRMVAWGGKVLTLVDLETNQRFEPLSLAPDSLCWSPDGSLLAAALYHDGQAQLQVLDRNGTLVYEQALPGRVFRLRWPQAGGLMAGALQADSYKFGTHVTEHLLRWDDLWQVTDIPLYETTLMPITMARLGEHLYQTFDFDLSPLGDEVLYTRVHAPPAFSSTRHLILHNLRSGEERQVANLPLLGGTGRLAADAESVLVVDGQGTIKKQDLWSGALRQQWPGSRFDYSAATDLLIADGRLFLDQLEFFDLPEASSAQFSLGGKFILIAWHKSLYRLEGYSVAAVPELEPEILERLLKLRYLRSRGLIEPNEYLDAKEKLAR